MPPRILHLRQLCLHCTTCEAHLATLDIQVTGPQGQRNYNTTLTYLNEYAKGEYQHTCHPCELTTNQLRTAAFQNTPPPGTRWEKQAANLSEHVENH